MLILVGQHCPRIYPSVLSLKGNIGESSADDLSTSLQNIEEPVQKIENNISPITYSNEYASDFPNTYIAPKSTQPSIVDQSHFSASVDTHNSLTRLFSSTSQLSSKPQTPDVRCYSQTDMPKTKLFSNPPHADSKNNGTQHGRTFTQSSQSLAKKQVKAKRLSSQVEFEMLTSPSTGISLRTLSYPTNQSTPFHSIEGTASSTENLLNNSNENISSGRHTKIKDETVYANNNTVNVPNGGPRSTMDHNSDELDQQASSEIGSRKTSPRRFSSPIKKYFYTSSPNRSCSSQSSMNNSTITQSPECPSPRPDDTVLKEDEFEHSL